MATKRAPAWHTTVLRTTAHATSDVEVEVRTSSRRRRSAGAFWQGDRIVVVLPASLARSQRQGMIDDLVSRLLAKRPHSTMSDACLFERANALSDRYLGGVRPLDVRWVSNQRSRWGSCSADTREIRISNRLKSAPAWVVDGVLVHELAHLIEPGHSKAFHDLANRYPRQHDVETFLAGFSLGLELRENTPDCSSLDLTR